MNNAKILEKIKKVLELSKNNPSAAEAESALLMAQKLMVQYNLTMEDVEGTTQEKSPEAQADYSVTSGSNTGYDCDEPYSARLQSGSIQRIDGQDLEQDFM